ncbi:MAG: sugar phosphate isomerase/epimerase family protein [Planctomycetota bacterium]|nr:sugar phosphate isomerase/epimerase family protein [Planctomycetota bacterium]
MKKITRRHALGAASGLAACGIGSRLLEGVTASPATQMPENLMPETSRYQPGPANEPKVRYCINTSTIRGQKLGIVAEVELAARVGYNGIEPWIREIDDYRQAGGSLKDLRKRIADHGMTVDSAIGFANWIVDDDQKRAKALEQAKREMDLVAQIGGKFIAAPPAGATNQEDLDLFAAARRYADLIRVGREIGVIPQVEVWGFSKTLSRLGECIFVAIESGCPDACVLPDIYHIYKGGSDYAGLGLLSGNTIQCFHINDFPADPPREKIGDAARVYPGDGVAPVTSILKSIFANGFRGALSLELFNRDYWKQDAEQVLRTGLQKMKTAVNKAS